MDIKLGQYIHIESILIHGFKILVILLVSFFVYAIGKGVVNRTLERFKVQMKRAQTLRGLLHNVLKYAVLFVSLAMVLREAGVDPVSLVAGAGIIGIALGFGAQSLVKDVISGFFILFEGAYAAGDFVRLHCTGAPDATGLVEEIGLRGTTLTELNGATTMVPNGVIVSVDRYPLGYVPYFVTMVFPADIGRKSLKEWLDSLSRDLERISKLLVDTPRIVEPMELSGGKIMARVKIHIAPCCENEIPMLIGQIKAFYKETFYQDMADPIVSELSEGAFQKYRTFFAPHQVLS